MSKILFPKTTRSLVNPIQRINFQVQYRSSGNLAFLHPKEALDHQFYGLKATSNPLSIVVMKLLEKILAHQPQPLNLRL